MEKAKRRQNFTINEINVLTDKVSKYKHILFAKFDSKITNQVKDNTWENIAQAVSAVGTPRTGKEIKVKWANLKMNAKQKTAIYKREVLSTGGGELLAEKPTEIEEKIAGLIGKDNFGIEGGIDTEDNENINTDEHEVEATTSSNVDINIECMKSKKMQNYS